MAETGLDLDALEALATAATEESGAWAVEWSEFGVSVGALGDGPEPGRAAARLVKDSRATTLCVIARLRVSRAARKTAVAEVARWQQAYEEQAAHHDAERAELRAAREVADADLALQETATPDRIERLNRARAVWREAASQP